MKTTFQLIGAISMVALLAACGGTYSGAKTDISHMTGSSPAPVSHPAPPPMAEHYDHHMMDTPTLNTPAQDQTAHDRANRLADQKYEHDKKVRNDMYERSKQDRVDHNHVMDQQRTDQEDSDAVAAQRRVDDAKVHQDSVAAQRKHVDDDAAKVNDTSADTHTTH
jgi:hypothetical protein